MDPVAIIRSAKRLGFDVKLGTDMQSLDIEGPSDRDGHIIRQIDEHKEAVVDYLRRTNWAVKRSRSSRGPKANNRTRRNGQRLAPSADGSRAPIDDRSANATALPSILLIDQRTEVATGRRLVKKSGDIFRWCDPWEKFVVWDGRRWKIDNTCAAQALGKQIADEIWREVKDELPTLERAQINSLVAFAKATSSDKGIAHMLSLARSEPGIPILPSALDTDPWLFNLQNGTLDLRTGKLREPRREDFITKLCPVAYDIDADCPRWCQFVSEIMDGNQELIDFLRRLAGYWLTGSVRDHVLPIFYGVGANGKSVLLNTLLAVLGPDYAMKAPSDFLLAKRGDSHPTEKADLFGMRLTVCIETEIGRRLAESLIKELSGGDRVRARRMKENFWEFAPTHKLVIASNHLPKVRGTDHGIWRRLRVVPFLIVIPEEQQDKQLEQKLLAELPGILNWCLAGCAEWQHSGLCQPQLVTDATESYRADNDIVAQFIADCCVVGGNVSVGVTDLFSAFVKWCESNGEVPPKRREFAKQIDSRGFAEDRLTVGPNKGRMIRRGIALRPNSEEGGEVSETTKR